MHTNTHIYVYTYTQKDIQTNTHILRTRPEHKHTKTFPNSGTTEQFWNKYFTRWSAVNYFRIPSREGWNLRSHFLLRRSSAARSRNSIKQAGSKISFLQPQITFFARHFRLSLKALPATLPTQLLSSTRTFTPCIYVFHISRKVPFSVSGSQER